MHQTSTIPGYFDRPSGERFTPLRGFGNAHLQTLLPRLLRRRVTLRPHWQRLDLPDSDFVDLAWS
ncbi:hydrolase [Plautia stali symbiont]|nr:hydrolase [Plautia stali symbiont]